MHLSLAQTVIQNLKSEIAELDKDDSSESELMERKLAEANLKIESLEKELRNRRSVEEAMNTNRLRKSRDEILLLKEKIISNARHQRKEALERLALEKQISELDQVIQQQVRQFHAEKEVLQKTIRETKLAFDSTKTKALEKEREMLQMYKEVLFLRESLLGAKKRISFLEKALEDERRRNVSLQVELEIKGKVVNQLEDEASELRKEVRWKDKQLFSMAKQIQENEDDKELIVWLELAKHSMEKKFLEEKAALEENLEMNENVIADMERVIEELEKNNKELNSEISELKRRIIEKDEDTAEISQLSEVEGEVESDSFEILEGSDSDKFPDTFGVESEDKKPSDFISSLYLDAIASHTSIISSPKPKGDYLLRSLWKNIGLEKWLENKWINFAFQQCFDTPCSFETNSLSGYISSEYKHQALQVLPQRAIQHKEVLGEGVFGIVRKVKVKDDQGNWLDAVLKERKFTNRKDIQMFEMEAAFFAN
ncbi:uncharacterized protein MCAP_0864-like [Palaemon carinicauda]|uniref:uncharacterized protein MCAP_0864-like n=1 Tax=Palaemon carinicauda TaxID=392227 RepID=UPI0035B618F4